MFGKRLRELRKQKNLTMKDLGKKFGLAESTISGYENGTRTPDLETIQKFATFFDVSMDYLVKGTEAHEGIGQANLSDEEREFLEILRTDPDSSSFFYDYSKAPEEQRREMIKTWRIIRELEKDRKPGQKQGE